MLVVKHISELKHLHPRIAIACGFFDGLHIGHQKVIHELKEYCEVHSLEPVIFTFDPHPRSILVHEEKPKLLTSSRHKVHLLKKMGIDVAIVSPFTKITAQQSPELFVSSCLTHDQIEVKAIFSGTEWHFGHKGQGTTETLKMLGDKYDFEVIPVEEEIFEEQKVSSSDIRNMIQHGLMDLVEMQLNRRFTLLGHVTHGAQIASKSLKHPTANLATDNEVFPPNGVYAGYAHLEDGKAYPGVLNIGNCPTFYSETEPEHYKLEFFIFDFDRDIYGQQMEVEFVEFIRPELNFDSTEELIEEIKNDVLIGKEILSVTEPSRAILRVTS